MSTQILAEPKDLVFISGRSETNLDLVSEYAAMMRDGVQFDPAQGVRDETGQVYVWDGQHRGAAAKLSGLCLRVEVQPGTKRDAEWLALSANQKHGLRRTKADEAWIARSALINFPDRSIREIHRHTGINRRKLSRIQGELVASGAIAPDTKVKVTRGSVTYEQDTRNIGSHKQEHTPIKPPAPHPYAGVQGTNTNGEGDEVQDQGPNSRSYSQPPLDPPAEHKPHSQEFECPHCQQERIVGVNGSRRWCLNCGAEWPTATALLRDIEAGPAQPSRSSREVVQTRFETLLERLDDEQVSELAAWLDEVEHKLNAADNKGEWVFSASGEPSKLLLTPSICPN